MVGVEIYAHRMQAKAQALVGSLLRIRSTDDAKQVIEEWRRRAGPRFWEESDQLGGDHCYDAQIHNLAVSPFMIVQSTVLNAAIAMRNGQVYYVLVTMKSGRTSGPMPAGAIWVQEWSEMGAPPIVHVSKNRKPWGAAVDLTSSAPEGKRNAAFGLRLSCFSDLRGCRSAEELLPNVWNLPTNNF